MIALARVNLLIFFLLVITPGVGKIFKTFSIGLGSYFNEAVSFLVLGLFFLLLLKKGKINNLILILFCFIGYSVFIIQKNGLPVTNSFIQVILYLQIFFFYFFFSLQEDETKSLTMSWSKKLFNILLITSLLFSILEIVFPELYSMVFGLEKQPRGIAGVYITSFFGARTSYAQFLLFFIFHHYSYKKEFGITSRNKLLLYLAFVLLIFAFSRKEFLFGLVFLFYFSEFRFKTKTQKYFAAVVVLGIVLISGYFYYTTFFSITNENTFSDGYSRVRLLLSAYEIIIDKFPFGSGPGTFGSQMSLNNTSIYEAYSVPEDLVYGWGDVPGPIYDIFLISFFVEYGIGLLFILMFFFKLSNRSFRNESHKKVIDFLLLYIISISFISPALMNWNGYLLLSFIGLLTSRKSFT